MGATRASDPLLTREEFRRRALARFGGLCCVCRERAATEAHHIFDRKLFADGGYREGNAAPVCEACHWRCETTELSVERVAARAGATPPRPACADAHGVEPGAEARSMDKWGNLLLPDGSLSPGPLALDDGCRKALAKGGKLWRLLPA